MFISEQSDLAPLFSGATNDTFTKIQRWGKSMEIGNILGVSGITDASVRRLLLHDTYLTVRKKNLFDPTTNFLSLLNSFGAVSTTTQAFKVGYEVYERQKLFITGATVTSTGNNSALKIVLPTTYSLESGIAADVDQILEVGDTRFQIRIVGVDNGTGAGLRKMGVMDTNAPMTAGAMGGTGTANVLVAIPLTTQTAPTITTSDKLFFVNNSREEKSCPSNSMLEAFPNIYESGFTITDSTKNFSGTFASTARNWKTVITNSKGTQSNLIVSDLDLELEENINNKLASAILFGQKETSTSVLSNSRHTRASNGIIPSIAVNGGTIIQTTPGSVTFANTITPLIDFCISKGIKSGKLMLGAGLYGDLQTAAATIPSAWIANAQVLPFSATSQGLSFNFTTNSISFKGITIELYQTDVLTDGNQWGIGYNNTGVFIPNKLTTVRNASSGQMIETPPIQVLYKKQQDGRVRDGSYETYDGGAGTPSHGTCDYAEKRRIAEFTVVSPLASECVLLQPKAASYFV